MNFIIENYAIDIRTVSALTGLSRSSIYDFVNPRSVRYKPDFPKSFRYSNNGRGAVRWKKSEVIAWIEKYASAKSSCEPIACQGSGKVTEIARSVESSAHSDLQIQCMGASMILSEKGSSWQPSMFKVFPVPSA
jgi:prophage regulatory protein